ncbi:MAG: SDR family oxidoreductase [Candidatus Lokiarchaeota archaeon]|nr:SDR family oxidoreductase [Candidatus Lokiarchaeota archaeon]
MFIEKLELEKNCLYNKVAIITGAGRGIGKELARCLAWLGAKVVIAEITPEGKDVETLIRKEGGEALYVKTDVSKENDILNLEKSILEKYGKVDILVNNAIVYAAGTLMELPMEAWDEMYHVNIRGAVFTIKTFLPHMLKQDNGVIVNVTSAGGTPYMAPYFASKVALASIAESLAAELDDTNISVFTFGPGMVDTPGIQEAARLLAPKFGMTEHEFQNQGVNPGYDGLMPAEHCAAGWAHAIVHAKEHHGQIASPFEVLLKFGLICQKKDSSSKSLETKRNLISKSVTELLNDVDTILLSLKKEIEGLGFFAKQWMKKTFIKRCGMTIEKFLEMLDELKIKLVDPESNLAWHVNCLQKLANHFKQNIEDAKGWIKDPDELELAIETLTYRSESVLSLIEKISIS